VPAGLLGVLIAGLLAAYMSNFAATVNAAPPYFVNDIYKRFINPHASPKTYVRLSYLSSFVVVLLGVLLGWYVTSVNNVVIWIVTALWGGYTASNVLKWYWWRFNGYGYFWGMVAGITSALTIPTLISRIAPLQDFAHTHSLNLEVSVGFGIVFLLSLIGCFLGTYLTVPADEEVLKEFYRRVRPWGFWGPILKKVQQEDPSFQANKDFFRDMFNIVVGIVWQIALVALPIYIVTWRLRAAALTFGIIAITSIILKFTWYDHLKDLEHINQYNALAKTEPETAPVVN
jgi:SSS family solute:Na+ symporter